MKETFSILRFICLIAIWLAFAVSGKAQGDPEQVPPCYTDELLSKLLEEHPELHEVRSQYEAAINQYRENVLFNNSGGEGIMGDPVNGAAGANYVIPVVFYIVHNNGPENISDQRVLDQMDKLNLAFNGHGIEFCLATKEGPNTLPGSVNNPGIIRIHSGLTNHLSAAQSSLMALSSLPSANYMRVFVVRDIDNGSGLLGYATLPGMNVLPSLDGIVVRHDIVGDNLAGVAPYDEGETLVHEVGHYLDLYHTFEGGCASPNSACNLTGDKVCDTPPAATSVFGCPAFLNSCGTPELLDNYMAYTHDGCKTSFTLGQEIRMICAINLFRYDLVSTDNLIHTGVECVDGLLFNFTASDYNPCIGQSVTFTPSSLSGVNYSWNFGDPGSGNGNFSTLQNPTHTFNNAGPYTVTLTVDDGTNSLSQSELIYVSDCSPLYSDQGNWYFHHYAGLDFSSGIPLADDAAWANSTIAGFPVSYSYGEACADQSDNNGNLLFYTDATNVWDGSHNLINSGNPLFGDLSCAGGTMSIPDPGNSNQYYIFTTNHHMSQLPAVNKGFRYSIVQVNGTTASMTSTVNVPIPPPNGGFDTGDNGAVMVGEGITAIAACDGYWIICNGRQGARYFLVYKLTASGLSFVNQFLNTNLALHSTLESSPDGNRLAISFVVNSQGTYVYDFDKINGVISNEQNVTPQYTYASSFSPNSQLLYVTAPLNGLFQYDLSVANPSATEQHLSVGSYRGIQTGPDGKIYAAENGEYSLSVIHDPDQVVTNTTPNACAFTTNGPDLNTVASGQNIEVQWGLPNMLDAKSSSAFGNDISCQITDCYTVSFNANFCPTGFNWDFGDPLSGSDNTSLDQNPTHMFSGPGVYVVTLNAGGTIVTKTVEVGMSVSITGAPTLCLQDGNLGYYSAVGAPPGAIINWSVSSTGSIVGLNGGSGVNVNWTSLPGTVTLTVEDESTGCSEIIEFVVTENCSDCDVTPHFWTTVDANFHCQFNFTDQTTLGSNCHIVGWYWDFGDPTTGAGNYSSLQNPIHYFSGNGTYTVCLQVIADCGGRTCYESVCYEVLVNDCEPIECEGNPAYTATTDAHNPCIFNFTDVSTVGAGCVITGWSWDFGDPSTGSSNTSLLQNPSHYFSSNGTYNVCLTVTSRCGNTDCVETYCQQMVVNNCSAEPCDLQVDYSHAVDVNDHCLHYFSDLTTIGQGCTITSWSWDFGDMASGSANSSPLQNPSHVFSGNGTYLVCLTVTANCNHNTCVETICRKVYVADCVDCDACDLAPTIGSSTSDGCTYIFTGSNNGTDCPTQSYSWDITTTLGLPVASGSGTNTTVTFPYSGLFNVCLTIQVQNPNGFVLCSEDVCIQINATCGGKQFKVKAQPNPAKDMVVFTVDDGEVNAEYGDLMVYDMRGAVVLKEQISLRTRHEADMSKLAPGTYYYRVTTAQEESATERLIILGRK